MTNKGTIWKAIVAFFIIQLLLVGSFIKTSVAETAPNSEILNLMSTLKVEGKEVIASRTEYTKMFQKSSKTSTVLVSATPLHYKDKAGKWQEIETALEDAKNDVDEDGRAFGFRSVKNSFESYLPKYSNGWVQARSGKYQVAFKLMVAGSRDFTRNSESIQASDVFNQCDLKWSITQGALKEDIILKDLSAPKSFEYLIRIHNLTVANQKDGSYIFKDEKGKTVFTIPQLIMVDSKQQTSEAIITKLEKQGKDYLLTVTPSQSWLGDSGRVFPITVDPTITMGPIKVNYDENLIYYIPSIDYLGNNSITPPISSTNLYGNNQSDLLWKNLVPGLCGLPYDTLISFTATGGGMELLGISGGPKIYPTLRILNWNPLSTDDSDSKWALPGDFLSTTEIKGNYGNSFTLKKAKQPSLR